jgi:DNA-damage-inducible protein D
MENSALTAVLDELRHEKANGEQYWMARDIQKTLNYATWQKFKPLIDKALTACTTLHLEPSHHINRVVNPNMTERDQVVAEDYFLSRHGCYLIAMNGESSKPEIAIAQQYFAAQTIRQESLDQMSQEDRRIYLRDRVRNANNALKGAAKSAGVHKYGVFQDAGYKGMYRSGVRAVKRKKSIDEKEQFLDCIDREELAANEFRITQTEAKLRNDGIDGQEPASTAHFDVGRKVRDTMIELSGNKPEDLPRAKNLKAVESERKKTLRASKKKLLKD